MNRKEEYTMKQLKLTLDEKNYNMLHTLAYQFGVNYNTLTSWLIDAFMQSEGYQECKDLLYYGICTQKEE